jgi:hypothetical protein
VADDEGGARADEQPADGDAQSDGDEQEDFVY